MPLNNPLKDFARILDEVEAVSNLHGLWCPGTYPTGVFPGPVPRDNFNPRVFTKPGGGSLGTPVRQHVDDGMGLTIGQDRAVDLAFVKREVVDAQDAWGGLCRKGRAMRASQQRVATRGHGDARALASPGLATKGQRKIAKRRIEPSRTLGGGSNKPWQTLTEGHGGTDRMQAAKATQLEQKPNRLSTQRHIVRLAGVVTVNAG